jgi:hypothetical protein
MNLMNPSETAFLVRSPDGHPPWRRPTSLARRGSDAVPLAVKKTPAVLPSQETTQQCRTRAHGKRQDDASGWERKGRFPVHPRPGGREQTARLPDREYCDDSPQRATGKHSQRSSADTVRWYTESAFRFVAGRAASQARVRTVLNAVHAAAYAFTGPP